MRNLSAQSKPKRRNILFKALAVFISFALLHNLVGLPASASVTLAERRTTQAILAGRVPVPALNDGTPLHEIAPEIADREATEAVLIVGEVYELRDATTRHFRHADGSFSAAIFPQPVHFLAADGTWQDIDNTLIFDGESFVPVASDLDVRIPQNFADGQQMTISQDGFTLGLGVSAQNEDVSLDTQASVIEEPVQAFAMASAELSVEEQNAEIMAAENLEGSVLYADLFAGASADMEQTVTPSGVETTIVIPQPQDNLEFLFDLDLGGLVAVPQADGAIFFFAPTDVTNVQTIERPAIVVEIPAEEPQEETDEEDDVYYNENEISEDEEAADVEDYDVLQEIYPVEEIELEREVIISPELEIIEFAPIQLGMPIDGAEPVFILQAPVMTDANGETALASMGFAVDGTLVIQADSEFMSTAAYPVAISPSIETWEISNISMTRVADGFNLSSHMLVGRGSGTTYRTYVRFNLPELPSGSVVSEAAFGVFQRDVSNFRAGNFLSLFVIPMPGTVGTNHPNWRHDRLNWSSSGVSWSNQPLIGDVRNARNYIVDFSSIPNSNIWHLFDITNTVRNWYENDSNNGLVFTSYDEGVPTRVRLGNTSVEPQIVIRYTTNVSLQSHWTYEVYEMGRSGTAFVNVHNGNLTWVHEDISMPGERLPIQISHVYNSSRDNFCGIYQGMRLNPGFRLNVIERLISHPVGDAVLGQRILRYTLVDGLGVVHHFTENADRSISHEFDPTLVLTTSGNTRIITDAQGNQRHYNMANQGFMFRIQDRHGNVNHINWDNNGRIADVTDSAGRSVIFGYNPAGYLTSMTDQAGRVTTFTHGSGTGLNITYPDGRQTRFSAANALDQITTYDGARFSFRYTQNPRIGRRVTRVEQHCRDNRIVDFITLAFSESNASGTAAGHTTLRNREYVESNGERGRRDVFLFAPGGNVQSVTNRQGLTQATFFYTSEDENGEQRLERVSQSNWLAISNNLLRNHGFEVGGHWTLRPGTGQAAIVGAAGQRAVRLQSYVTNGGGEAAQIFSGRPGETYTLTADVFIPEELIGSGGASVLLEWQEGSTLRHAGQSIRMTNGWERVGLTFTIPETAQANRPFSVVLMLHNAAGEVFFDNVQLEQSGGAGLYNHIENSDFRFNTRSGTVNGQPRFVANNWQLRRGLDSDSLVPVPSAQGPDGVFWNQVQGNYFFAVGGHHSQIQMLTQNVPLNVPAGETLTIGGHGYAYAMPPRPTQRDERGNVVVAGRDSRFGIQARIFYACNHPATTVHIDFNPHIPMVQQKAVGYHVLERDAVRVEFSFVFGLQMNGAAFRNAFIYTAPFGEHIEFNEDGQPERIRSSDGTTMYVDYGDDNQAQGFSAQSSNNAGRHQVQSITQTHGGNITSQMTFAHTSNGDVEYVTDEKTGMVTSFIYDRFGNVTSRTIRNGDLSLTESMVYTPCGNFLLEHTDFNDNTSYFAWDTVLIGGREVVSRGLLLSATDPNGNTITYTYCPTTDQLLSVSGTGRPGQVVTTSFDVQDQLATITRSHRGGTYSYRYDSRGRTTHAMVGNVALVTNTYNDQNDQLVQQLFANGDRFEPVFDNRGRLVAEYWNGVRAVTYYYNENDRLSQLIDHTGDEDVTQRFDYDFAGRLVRVSGTDGLTTHITYDANGAPTLLRTELNGEVIHDSLFLTNMQGQPMDASFFALGASLSYTYDGLNRPIQRSLMMPNAAVSTSLIFQQDEETGATRNLVETFRNELFGGMLLHEWTYKYDAAGNITRITDHNNRVTEFTFDGLNRLTSETIDGILWEYEFDAGGNITEIRRGGVVEHTLSFGNPNWPDQLTAFDGRTITYDRIGNPLTYGNYSFTWERGRLLTRVYYNGELLHRFGYDAAGRRVSRTSYDGPEPVTTRFYYMGQQLIRQCDGTDTLDFTWDADGRPVGFTHNGTPYFYLLNLLGDVVAIMDADGNIVAEYTYDAWGNVTVFEGRQPVNAPAPTQQSAPAQQHASVAPAASVEAMLNTTAARTPVAVAALAADEPCELFVFAERAFLRMMLAELGLDEESKQALVPAMQTLGLGDRAAVLRAFAAQGVCESYLDMVFLLIENQIWRVELLVEQIFISLFLSETTLDDLGLGVFEPFFAYYAQVFAGLVELLGAYIGIENPDAEILMEFLPFLTAMFEVAFELLTEEMQVDIRAYARAPMLVHQALMAAGEPESAQLDQFLFNMLGLNNPEVAVNRLTCCCLDLGLTREAATAQIAAWRWGENTNHLADYLASRLQVCAYCCFDADWLNTVVGTVISVLYTNFAQLLQDWFNRFNVSRATCELFAFAERLLLRTLIAEVLYVEEADKQVIVSRMQELGLADRAALLRYYQAHGVCESFLDVLFELFDMGWTAELLIEQIFIPVFLSELELNEQSAGVFLPFFAYYAQVFSGLVQLFWEYFDFASLGISMPLFLQLFTPFLAATFELAFELLTEEAHAQIQAYARGPMLVHRALMAAGVPESAELDSVIAQLAFANIITPENLHWFLTCCCQSALDDAAAIAQIATWIAGDNTTYLADYLDWAIDNAFLGWDLPDDLIDLIEQIYYANFAQFLQDWFGVFEWDMSCSWCGDSGELCARCNPSGCPIDPGAPCVCPDCALCDDSGAYCAACNPSDCPVDPGAPCVCPDCALCGDSGELCSQCNPGCPNDCDCPECYVPLQVLGIGHLNPIRYRGKFYCDSMGWYWLQTRFYNPQWRRFINADTFFIAGEDGLSAITAANMFAYANGNPVMMIDPDGRSAVDGVNVDYEHPFLVALEIIVGFIVGVIIWIKAAPAAFTITVVVLISILLVAALLPHVFQFFSDVMAFLGNILTEWEEVGLLDWLRSLGNGSNLFEVEGYGYFLTGSESANASLQQLQSIDVAPLDIDRSRHRTNIRYAHLFYNATHEVFESVDLRVVTTRGNNVEWFYGSSINIGNNQTPDYTGREITVTASDGVSVRNLTAIVRNTFGNSSGILIGSTLPVAIVTAEKENRMMDSITAGGFNEFILYTRDAHLGPLPQNYNSTNASLFLENGSLVHLLGYYGDFYLVQAGGRVLFWNAQQHMRMSPQGFALLARMEAPSPAPDQHTTHPANLTLYRTNASGRITYVRNHRNPGENIATVTVGYGLYVDPRITEGQRLRDYLRNTYGIDTTTLNYWTRGPVAVSLLHNLAGTVRTPGTQVIDHSERTWEVAGWIGRTRLTQWEFDALSYVVIVGRNSARAEILFGSVTSSDSDNAVARVIHNASTGGNITRWESAVAVIRRGDYSGSPRGAFDPLNVA